MALYNNALLSLWLLTIKINICENTKRDPFNVGMCCIDWTFVWAGN